MSRKGLLIQRALAIIMFTEPEQRIVLIVLILKSILLTLNIILSFVDDNSFIISVHFLRVFVLDTFSPGSMFDSWLELNILLISDIF